MVKRIYNHLKFQSKSSDIHFSGTGMGNDNFPIGRPNDYFEEKRKELEEIKNRFKKQNKPVRGILKISGEAGKDLLFPSLDSSTYNLRLLSIKESWEKDEKQITANIQFKDESSFDKFSKSLYTTRKDVSKQSRLCVTIKTIEELKSFEDLVTDYSLPENFDPLKKYWVEIWLPNDDGLAVEFTNFLQKNFTDVIFNPRLLNLGDRDVILVNTKKEVLDSLCNQLSYIAEIRFSKRVIHLLDREMGEKLEFSDNLLQRIKIDENINTTSVVLDTGVNRGHPFLEKVLSSDRNLTLKEEWGSHDEAHFDKGKIYHGTGISGLCIYGDFCDLLKTNDDIVIKHNLTSVKIFSPNPQEENEIIDLPATAINDAINLAKESSPYNKNYILTTTIGVNNSGIPTSYSTSIDKTIFEKKLLFIVSVGNVMPEMTSMDIHNTTQKSTCVEDPSQSWNSLSIGAYTTKVDCSNLRSEGIHPLSESGDISPYTRFSMVDYKYDNLPLKPDLLFEGGNLAVDRANIVLQDYHFSLITTNHDFQNNGYFTNFDATSAATALAGRFASILMSSYPEYWPETIKGLMIHSAQWTETMQKRLPKTINSSNVDQKINFLRQCGFGVPDLERAKKSAQNSLTLVSQNEFYLFNSEKKSQCVSFDLPWPTETLEKLSNKKISLRVTLSYFIIPKAGSRGNKNKFKYQSHGLRFELKRKDDIDEKAFHQRINKALLRNKEDDINESSPVSWILGPKVRNKVAGTVLKDMWEGSGTDLASMDKLVVYPINGWWKEDKTIKPEDSKVRFSLIVDVEVDDEAIDLYNEIKAILEVPVTTLVEISS